jgi:hypothetical protein
VTDGTTTETYWFGVIVPGMPVRYQIEDDGVVTTTVTMVRDDRPG